MTFVNKLINKIIKKTRSLKLQYLPFHNYRIRSEFGYNILLDVRKDVDRFFYLGLFEYQTLHFFQKTVLKGAVVFDVGANIGIYSLLAGKKAGQQGHVYSFEPADLAYQRLNKNIRINKFENISVYKQGVSDKNGTTNFYVCEDDAYNSIGSRPMNKVKEVKNIDITSIDEFCIKNNIRRIDVLKIDTEGADLLVLQGAKSVLTSETPPIIFCEFNKNIKSGFNFSLDDYRDFIISMKYRIYEIKNNMLHEFNPVQSNASEILCIHENKIGFYQTLANKK